MVRPLGQQLRYGSGRLCLDLVMTVGSRLSDHPVERLGSPERLAEWLVGAGLATEHLSVTVSDLLRAQELREALHRVMHAVVGNQAPAARDIETINASAARTLSPPQLRLDRTETNVGLVADSSASGVDVALSVIARDAIDLLTGPRVGDLRVCEGDTCDAVYLDTSRGHRRRWCSSERCGNRARVSAHRARRGSRS